MAIQDLARRHDGGLFFADFPDLAAQLRDQERLTAMTAAMRAARHTFAFDTHVDRLIDLFRRPIATYGTRSSPST